MDILKTLNDDLSWVLENGKKALSLDAPIFPWAKNPADKLAAGDAAAAGTARAGGSPSQQQAAKQEALNAYDSARRNFDKNNPASSIIQRAADALGGTTNSGDVVQINWPSLSTPDSPSSQFDWKSIVIVGLLFFLAFVILKEVL
jgi:hypothetical protein